MEVGKLVFTADPGGLPLFMSPYRATTHDVFSHDKICLRQYMCNPKVLGQLIHFLSLSLFFELSLSKGETKY